MSKSPTVSRKYHEAHVAEQRKVLDARYQELIDKAALSLNEQAAAHRKDIQATAEQHQKHLDDLNAMIVKLDRENRKLESDVDQLTNGVRRRCMLIDQQALELASRPTRGNQYFERSRDVFNNRIVAETNPASTNS